MVERPAQQFDLWTHADMAERWPEPVTPLTWALADLINNGNFQYALRDVGALQRPDIELYVLRVFDDQGIGDEFGILAALQFVRYLNSHSPTPRIHGVNLSLSLERDVSNCACSGRRSA
jgi:hypothetical protein